jgi:hypothetical protein
MKEERTTSILQRVPVILAVTRASYGLPPHASAKPSDTRNKHRDSAGPGRPERDTTVRNGAPQRH